MARLSPESALLTHFSLPLWVLLPLTIFSFELLAYGLHLAMHKLPLLWRIHAVHHNDTRLDVSTAFRHHPFEGMLSTMLSMLLLIWVGFHEIAAYIYTALRLLIVQFSHASIRLPGKLDKVMRIFVVTPDFHLVHHLNEKTYTDMYYGTVTPWFDYLFGSARVLPQKQLIEQKIGLKYLRANEDSRIDSLLAIPFLKWDRK